MTAKLVLRPKEMTVRLIGLSIILMIADATGDAAPYSYNGSTTLEVSQRFFADQKFGHVNGFSKWGAIQFDATFGLYEFWSGLEPILGVGFIKNTASLYALDETTGAIVRDQSGVPLRSEDKLDYQLYSVSLGLRHKFWEREFFIAAPFIQTQAIYRYGRVQKRSFDENPDKVITGGDFGAELAAGVIISFLYDAAKRHELSSTWNLKDFGFIASCSYLPAGFFRHGLGIVQQTGGWKFGGGLFLDW